MVTPEQETQYTEHLKSLDFNQITLLLLLAQETWEAGLKADTLWQHQDSQMLMSILANFINQNTVEHLGESFAGSYRLTDENFNNWLLTISSLPTITSLIEGKKLEHQFPPPKDTRYTFHTLGVGGSRSVGSTFKLGLPFQVAIDAGARYTEKDSQIVAEHWDKVVQNPTSFSVDLYNKYLLKKAQGLLDDEALFISRAAATIGSLNGSVIGEFAKTNADIELIKDKRNRIYQSKDFNISKVSDWVGENIMMCAEVSLVLQALSELNSVGPGYHMAYVRAVVQNPLGRETEGHACCILINEAYQRFVLVDITLGVWADLENGQDKLRAVPFVALLNEAQIREFEKGKRVNITSMNKERTYRIGELSTLPGSYEYNYLLSRDESGKMRSAK